MKKVIAFTIAALMVLAVPGSVLANHPSHNSQPHKTQAGKQGKKMSSSNAANNNSASLGSSSIALASAPTADGGRFVNPNSRIARSTVFRTINGTVTSNDGSAIVFRNNLGLLTVVFTPGVIILDSTGGPLNITDLAVGHRIQVKGLLDYPARVITAQQVIDNSLPVVVVTP